MASSYNTIGLELMATGENAGTWGDKTNDNLNLIEQAIAGYEAVTITDSTTTTLVMTNAALSNARNMVIKIATITLTGATTVTIPDGVEKFYIFDLTAVTGVTNLTIKTASGTGFTAGEAKIVAAYSDGTDLKEIALDTLGGTIGSAQIADNAIISAKISANQVTTVKIADNAITTAKISALQVTADKIANSTITAAKLATDSVGPDQLISTGVTAGSYTVASITVDADGRISAASSGSAGAAQYILTHGAAGSLGGYSYSFIANPATTKINVLLGGGGGGGGTRNNPSSPPWPYGSADGGYGGLGYFSFNIAAPYTNEFFVGAGGGFSYSEGQPGQASTFGNPVVLATANGGGAASYYGPSSPVNRSNPPGTAPGSYKDLSIINPPPGNVPSNTQKFYGPLSGLFPDGNFNTPTKIIGRDLITGYGRGGPPWPDFPTEQKGGSGIVMIWENILT
jgi:hypothetical protein